MCHRRSSTGFSLIELIVVILLVGILAAGAGYLIRNPIDAYDAQVRRQQLVDQGEMALRQIAIDVRKALPNSLRVTSVGTGYAVEMINVVDGARYRDEIGGTDFVDPEHVLDFVVADDQFNILGKLPLTTDAELMAGDHRLVIYNTSPVNIYSEATDTDLEGIITVGDPMIMTVSLSTLNLGTDDEEHHITITPAFKFTEQSPGQRVYVVDGPISYVCDPVSGQLLRYAGYAYQVAQPTAPVDFGVVPDRVVSQLGACTMTYDPGTAARGGLLSVEITVTEGAESASLLHQIHVVNVP